MLPEGFTPDAARAIRERAGVGAWLVSEARVVPARAEGFILGFSGHAPADLAAAAARLGTAVRDHVQP